MSSQHYPVHGAGLGLRRAMLSSLADQTAPPVDFWEVAPENWINVGGRYGKTFRELTERFPFICHGLSLSIGGPSPLDEAFLQRLKRFLREHRIRYYSEHLSYCSDDGHLYDLLPIPFTEEAVRYVTDRIRRVQDILEQRIAIENVSYYAAPGKTLEEIDFLTAVLQEADCDLLLDVNNIYVNSVNHRYDAETFLHQLPAARIRYIHVAGHYREAEDLIVDTHGADVIDPVWQLLDKTYQHFGVIPTLLERDFNLPPLADLLQEVAVIRELQSKWQDQTGEHIQHG
ncbi:DUF692 domain-containing protein [Nitrosomonas oligotropha]|uniref:HvfB family MNIO-type RiPP peptide maturase n=1 Tax=Nitrosomonas oligotropha TaxID=42354 RepID=UPI00136ADFF7|nr:DUF692 domain-containing protein [Nitrosomonas oligotropha]MXS82860.1 DUF692 domain-containing protein [Nitrosomonas oligotropha]